MDELKKKIGERVDPDELIEILDLSTEELLYYLSDCIEECRDKFHFLDEDYS